MFINQPFDNRKSSIESEQSERCDERTILLGYKQQKTSTQHSKICFEESYIPIIAIAMFLLTIAIVYPFHHVKGNGTVHVYEGLYDQVRLFVNVSNEYGPFTAQKYPYPFLETDLFAETHKVNTFAISTSQAISKGCQFAYEIYEFDNPISTRVSGIISNQDRVFYFEPTKPGKYHLAIDMECDDHVIHSHKAVVWSKYVRRELLSLSEDDREMFLDAINVLWTVNTRDGKAIYGEKYKSVRHLAVIHNDGGANPVCDEFHGDVGFLVNHIILGAYLEQSLQLVNPKTCLHYMSYYNYFSSSALTIHNSRQLDGGTWTEVMTSTWFGSNDPWTGRIIDGRWENTTMPILNHEFFEDEEIDPNTTFFPVEDGDWWEAVSYAHLHSPYGYLRSPWSFNPSPYLTRYNNVNGIDDITEVSYKTRSTYSGVNYHQYTTFVAQVYQQPLSFLLLGLEGGTHGSVHFTFGGAGGEYSHRAINYLIDRYNLTIDDVMVAAIASSVFFKAHMDWTRIGTSSPLHCWHADSTLLNGAFLSRNLIPGANDGPSCDCNVEYYQSEDSLNLLIKMYFSPPPTEFEADDSTSSLYDRVMLLDFESKIDIMQNLCSRFQFEGDMASSAAAMDPLFWVAHGTVEKLYQNLVLMDWLEDDLYIETSAESCSGHASNGTKAWLDGLTIYPHMESSRLTNIDLMNYLNPTTDLFRDYMTALYDHEDMIDLLKSANVMLQKKSHS